MFLGNVFFFHIQIWRMEKYDRPEILIFWFLWNEIYDKRQGIYRSPLLTA